MHLVTPDDGATEEPRFTMLETIREFARERLAGTGEEVLLRERHGEYLLAWGEVAGRRLESAQERRWLSRVERELPNVRAALGRLRDRGDLNEGLRLAAALGPFWLNAGYVVEGRRWIEEFLHASVAAEVEAPARSAALTWSATLAAEQGEVRAEQGGAAAAIGRLEEALALSREHDDLRGVLRALGWLVQVLMLHGDAERAVALADEGIARCRAEGDRWWLASFLYRATLLAQIRGEHASAMALARECVAVAREAGHGRMAARGVQALAQLRSVAEPDRMDLVYAELEEALALAEAAGDTRQVSTTLMDLGGTAVELGDTRLAAHWLHRALMLAPRIGSWQVLTYSIAATSEIARARGDDTLFARLYGVLQRSLEVMRRGLPAEYWDTYQQRAAGMRATLGEAAFAAAAREGAGLSWDDAIAEARAYTERVALEAGAGLPPAATATREPGDAGGLTPREREVLQLIAAGRTNHEIAETLVLSVRTVERHIETIYSKIGVRGRAARAAAAAYAIEHGLT
jgi:non-specific serine/threonine protein kinase